MFRYIYIAILPLFFKFEPPGWGKVYAWLIGSYENDPSWKTAPRKIVRDKITNNYFIADLRQWSGRQHFFLQRWYELSSIMLLQAALKEGDTVVDVGANVGHFSLVASRLVGERGSVHSFEPNPATFAVLTVNKQLNDFGHLNLSNIALADQNAEMVLSIPKVNHGEATLGDTVYEADTVERVSVEVRIADEVLENTTPNFVKIDVEGYELPVLLGLKKTIEKSKPLILMEYVPQHIENAGFKPKELENMMRANDYKLFSPTIQRRFYKNTLLLKQLKSLDESKNLNVLWVPSQYEDRINQINQQ